MRRFAIMLALIFVAGASARAEGVKPKNQNEAAVIGLLDMAFNQKRIEEAIGKFIGPYYRQHNPTVADGKEALLASMRAFMPTVPGLRYTFKHLYSDGDRVIVHSRVQMSPEDRGIAVVDIFRLEDGKIVEHWDVVQPMPEKPLNDNGMF